MQKANHFKLKPAAKPLSDRPERKSFATEQIGSKMTSPTLVEFRNQNAQLPEWRLQLQNAVQQRMKNSGNAEGSSPVPAGGSAAGDTNPSESSAEPAASENRYLSKALKRIETSRSRYLVAETPKAPTKTAEAPKKEFPFTIAARTEDLPVKKNESEAEAETPKPKLVEKKKSIPIKDLYDTSELDPQFPPAKLSSSFAAVPAVAKTEPDPKKPAPEIKAEAPNAEPSEPVTSTFGVGVPEARAETSEEPVNEVVTEGGAIEEYDDYASLSVRFNAGIFDFLIGSFLSFVLLLPFVFAGGSWFTLTGLAAFAATCAIVMFVYLTASVGFAGKSFGMHIFSLEMIDVGGENYPSFHQSAVSAAVYLVSVACLGVGFVTALFDRDRRAAHDLLSGTLVVREL
ncbi:MAG: RDD family protein [Acidobacteriota bacterium]|nr:MAG: RDD family protein [Acidobacteriota bacterium]